MPKRKLVAAAALSAGLLVGGAAGLILGIPGVSNAQTTTVPGDGSTPGDQPAGHRCHDGSGDTAPGTSPSASNTAIKFL